MKNERKQKIKEMKNKKQTKIRQPNVLTYSLPIPIRTEWKEKSCFLKKQKLNAMKTRGKKANSNTHTRHPIYIGMSVNERVSE